jgi:hypothetical protein
MSKAALNMLTRLLAFDLKPYNITTIHLTAEQDGGFYKWNGEAHSW